MNLFNKNTSTGKSNRFRPDMEALESREVLSTVSVAAPDMDLAVLRGTTEDADHVVAESALATHAEGAVNYSGDTDYFRFKAVAGQTYTLQTALKSLTDTTLTVYDPSGRQVAFNDDGGEGLASRIQFTAAADGTCTVRVAAYGRWQSGTYSLLISQPVAASRIEGNIASQNEADIYAFDAVAGERYVIETSLKTLADSTLTVYGPDGQTRLAFNDDSGAGLASRIVFTAPGDGIYFVKVAAYGSWQTGTYDVTISQSDIAGAAAALDAGAYLQHDRWDVVDAVFQTYSDLDDVAQSSSYSVESVGSLPVPIPQPGDYIGSLPVPIPQPGDYISSLPVPIPQPGDYCGALPIPLLNQAIQFDLV